MKSVGIIPARMGSSRFPGKPLVPILGMPMIEHVYRRCCLSDALANVYVATCDEVIADAIRSMGGDVIMTSRDCPRAADRLAEAPREVDADVLVTSFPSHPQQPTESQA